MLLPLTLTLHHSRRLGLLLGAMHLGAATAASLISIPWWIKLVLLSLILASALRQLFGLTGKNRICRLTLKDDGRLEFSREDGSGGEARLHPQSTVTSPLVVLLLRLEGRVESLVFLPDSLDEEDFRQLRLWLRWCAPGNE
jgi:toxin CptA